MVDFDMPFIAYYNVATREVEVPGARAKVSARKAERRLEPMKIPVRLLGVVFQTE
jgi:hypothetical protein